LDILFINVEVANASTEHLFTFIVFDLITFLNNNFLFSQTLFYTDYQDFFLFVTHHSPELIFAFNDYLLTYFSNALIGQTPSIVFDTYTDNLNITLSEFLEYFLLFCTFI